MRSKARIRRWSAPAMIAVLVLAPAAMAGAQTKGPIVAGSVIGSLDAGGQLTIQISATEVGGWQNLDRLSVSIVSGGQPVERLDYDVANVTVSIGGLSFLAGTGGQAQGNYLSVTGPAVTVLTGGGTVEVTMPATVLKAIPSAATFRLEASDAFGASASVVRRIRAPAGTGGVSWGTVIGVVVAALFAGGFVGNLFASHRRAPARPSIYGAIQRRMEEERRAGTAPPAAGKSATP